MINDLLLIAMQEMDTEIKAKRREWEKLGGREDQIDRSNYLDGFFHAWKIANRVYNKGAKNTEQPTSEEACRAALRDCVEALEAAQPYVESYGWTRHLYAEIAQV